MDCHVYLVHAKAGDDEAALQEQAVRRVTSEWESRGEKVYYIPMGGSNEIGALGYYDCALELDAQVRQMQLPDNKQKAETFVGKNSFNPVGNRRDCLLRILVLLHTYRSADMGLIYFTKVNRYRFGWAVF